MEGGSNTIRILNVSYPIKDIPGPLKRKLNGIFPDQNIKAKEILEQDALIRALIGDYAVKRMSGEVRFYVIDALTRKMRTMLERKLGNGDITVGTVFRKLDASGIKVFLKGGIVRDTFMGVDSIDVDAVFDSDINKIKEIGDIEGWQIDNLSYKYQSMNIGGAKGVSIDLVNLKSTFLAPVIAHEFTINDLVFDWRANVLIDLTGYGLSDVVNRVIRISPTPNLYNKWASSDWKKPLRYFKLLLKGFTPMTPKLHKFIINYIERNLDTIYFSALYENVSRLKHYLIKNITNGVINPDGSYEYGVNKRSITPFLLTMKHYVSPETFERIILILRSDSRDKYLTRVATRLSMNKIKQTKKKIMQSSAN